MFISILPHKSMRSVHFCMPLWYAVSLCSEDLECNKFKMFGYKGIQPSYDVYDQKIKMSEGVSNLRMYW